LRTFNALTKTPMAHLRKKEKWPDHARAMIEGKSLAKTAALCGVHPTTAFRWRHRFLRAPASDKPRSLRGLVEADETFILESFKGRWSDLPRKA
jgi:transposase-like protein